VLMLLIGVMHEQVASDAVDVRRRHRTPPCGSFYTAKTLSSRREGPQLIGMFPGRDFCRHAARLNSFDAKARDQQPRAFNRRLF
jgi:hypothetical protein